MKSKNKQNTEWILEEIQRAIHSGIAVRIDGIRKQELFSEVKEEITYMEDYIGDENGKIIEISFSRVKIPKKNRAGYHNPD